MNPGSRDTRSSLTLDVDGTIELVEFDASDLESIYRTIGRGCTIFQALPKVSKLVPSAWIDENGKLNNLPINIYATDLLRTAGAIRPKDWICGRVMFVGEPNEGGGVTNVPTTFESELRSFVGGYEPVVMYFQGGR